MRYIILACIFSTCPAQPLLAAPPNVVVIFTDDQGSLDLGSYGAADLATPHVDALAASGVRFTQFYAAAPVCSPSRAGLLTGRHPWEAGMPSNAGEVGMPQEEVTLADLFKTADYRTALIGKWHLGHTHETTPLRQGFDYFFGHLGGCIDNYSHFFYWNGPNRHDLWRNDTEVYENGKFFPDLMVDEALQWIDGEQEKPFFLYFASNAPHYPYQGDEKWLQHYAAQAMDYPRNLYAAFLSTLDERIGRLLAGLEERGLRENTIIVYQSDHGHSMEERAHHGGGSAGPYRGAKFSLFEGGLRVPAIISWPGHLPANETRDQLAHGCDWFPTLARLCGIDLPELSLAGKDLSAVLRDAEANSPHKTLHWEVPRGARVQWAVRQGPWKLLGHPHDPSSDAPVDLHEGLFLANLAEDIGEAQNRATDFPEVVEELIAERKKIRPEFAWPE